MRIMTVCGSLATSAILGDSYGIHQPRSKEMKCFAKAAPLASSVKEGNDTKYSTGEVYDSSYKVTATT